MKKLLTKENFNLIETVFGSEYVYDSENFKLRIAKEDFTDEEINFSNQLVNAYSDNLEKIATACFESDTFEMCYPTETVQTIMHKLKSPIFRRMDDGITLLTYVEHELDADHILDIEINGLYEEILDISIDG